MVFFENLDRFGGAVALETAAAEVTDYQSLAGMAAAFAAACTPRSLAFALCDNSVASVAGYLGFLRAGVVPVLLGRELHPAALAALLGQYRPRYLWLPVERPEAATLGAVVHRLGGYVLVQTTLAQDYALHLDLALLLTTSGSTGSPMLVRQSYTNIASNARAIAQYLGIQAADALHLWPVHSEQPFALRLQHLAQ